MLKPKNLKKMSKCGKIYYRVIKIIIRGDLMSKEKEYRGKIRYNPGKYYDYDSVDLNNTKITGRNISIPGKGINVIPDRDSYGYRVPKKGVTNVTAPRRSSNSIIDQGNNGKGKTKKVRLTAKKSEAKRMSNLPKEEIVEVTKKRHPLLMKIRYWISCNCNYYSNFI